jgi:hypothetical protein
MLAAVLDRFEREPVTSPLLAGLHKELVTGGRRPSQVVRRLRVLVDLFDSRRNQFFAPVALLTMWEVHCALAIEAWRARHGHSVDAWLAAVGQLEALCSLAGFAWEHPADVYPELDPPGTQFEAWALGHPLIPEVRCIRNDVAIGGATRVLIVSGSNMSGKSTLLRSVGTNVVLALAGAPVRARALRLSRLSVGATLRIRDSLQEGTSRFYAELVRLRDLVRIADGPVPLLFLLDEILHGTNSHDRRLGAAAVVSGLVERGAIGLVTTHDLALSEVTSDPAVRAANVHFEDRLEDGQMIFDYRVRPGVVRTSNELALMRTLGLWKDGSSTLLMAAPSPGLAGSALLISRTSDLDGNRPTSRRLTRRTARDRGIGAQARFRAKMSMQALGLPRRGTNAASRRKDAGRRRRPSARRARLRRARLDARRRPAGG